VRALASTRCLPVPRSFAYFWARSLQAAYRGGGDIAVCSPRGVPFAWTQVALAAPACADFGSWFSWWWGSSQTLHRHILLLPILEFFVDRRMKKRPMGLIVLVRSPHSNQDPD